MKRSPHIRLVPHIGDVTPGDADAVRAGFADHFASLRPTLAKGKLGALRDLARNVVTLFELLVDPSFSVPWRTTAAVVFALAYFLSAFDAIPDVVPVLGFMDDALVVAEVVYLLAGDLRRYERHRAARAAVGTSSSDRAPDSGERLVA